MTNQDRQSLKIAVIGDIHDQWEEADAQALKHLGVDLVLFVGDFGNESVEIVRAIAALDLPKALVFGNHDAWYTATDWGRKKCPYNRQLEDRVQEQIDLVGAAHVGYGKRDFPEFGLTVVGTRPFSWGGPDWKYGDFYQERFGVKSLAESTVRIINAAATGQFQTVIFLGHNGPSGLGEAPEDLCGRDWNPLGGDFGDPDFEDAIAQTQSLGKTIPLVAFGHMHHTLRHTKTRLRKRLDVSATGTVYLNAACVNRIREVNHQKQRNFSIVQLQNGQVTDVSLVWVGSNFEIVEKEVLYQQNPLVKATVSLL